MPILPPRLFRYLSLGAILNFSNLTTLFGHLTFGTILKIIGRVDFFCRRVNVKQPPCRLFVVNNIELFVDF